MHESNSMRCSQWQYVLHSHRTSECALNKGLQLFTTTSLFKMVVGIRTQRDKRVEQSRTR
jgi:hypothetical protein